MSWVAVAVAGGTVIAGGLSANSAKKAAKSQADASGAAIDFQRESRDLALGLQKPYRDASYAATAALMDLTALARPGPRTALSFEEWAAQQPAPPPPQKKKKKGLFGGGLLGGLLAPSPKNFLKSHLDPLGAIVSQVRGGGGNAGSPDLQAGYKKYLDEFDATPDLGSYGKYNFTADPGYEFRLGEGNRALEHSLVARSGALSGAAAKSALRYAQGFASQEYQNVYNRVAQIAGFGAPAANSGSNAVLQTGANVSNAILNAGDARASSYIAQGNNMANTVGQLAMGAGMYFGRPS
jgi:hypothetical protein